MTDILFLIAYFIISIILSSLYTYKDRCFIHQSFHKQPPKKMHWQTLLEIFLLHIFTIVITIAILPYLESNEMMADSITCFGSLLLVIMYWIYYIANHNICAGIDFMLILITMGVLNMLLRYLKLFEGLYYKAWMKSSETVFIAFLTYFFSVTITLYVAYRIFPNTRERIRRLWDGGDSNDK